MDYDDIINLPHPESTTHPRMPLDERAAQFAPFAALRGFGEAINDTARKRSSTTTEDRYEIDDLTLTDTEFGNR